MKNPEKKHHLLISPSCSLGVGTHVDEWALKPAFSFHSVCTSSQSLYDHPLRVDKKRTSGVRYSPILIQNTIAPLENCITLELAYVKPQELALFPIKIKPLFFTLNSYLESLLHHYFHHLYFVILMASGYFAAHHAQIQEPL